LIPPFLLIPGELIEGSYYLDILPVTAVYYRLGISSCALLTKI